MSSPSFQFYPHLKSRRLACRPHETSQKTKNKLHSKGNAKVIRLAKFGDQKSCRFLIKAKPIPHGFFWTTYELTTLLFLLLQQPRKLFSKKKKNRARIHNFLHSQLQAFRPSSVFLGANRYNIFCLWEPPKRSSRYFFEDLFSIQHFFTSLRPWPNFWHLNESEWKFENGCTRPCLSTSFFQKFGVYWKY